MERPPGLVSGPWRPERDLAHVVLEFAVQAAGGLDGAAIRDWLRALGGGPGMRGCRPGGENGQWRGARRIAERNVVGKRR